MSRSPVISPLHPDPSVTPYNKQWTKHQINNCNKIKRRKKYLALHAGGRFLDYPLPHLSIFFNTSTHTCLVLGAFFIVLCLIYLKMFTSFGIFLSIVNKHYKKNKNFKKSTMVLVYQPQILHLALAIKNLRCHFFCFFCLQTKNCFTRCFRRARFGRAAIFEQFKGIVQITKKHGCFLPKSSAIPGYRLYVVMQLSCTAVWDKWTSFLKKATMFYIPFKCHAVVLIHDHHCMYIRFPRHWKFPTSPALIFVLETGFCWSPQAGQINHMADLTPLLGRISLVSEPCLVMKCVFAVYSFI